jgi:hypothetical protein
LRRRREGNMEDKEMKQGFEEDEMTAPQSHFDLL